MKHIVSEFDLSEDVKWSTIRDITNKLVIHYTYHVTVYRIDKDRCDPDGLPTVLMDYRRVTRVRKMTEQEYVAEVKNRGIKIELDMRILRDKDVSTKE